MRSIRSLPPLLFLLAIVLSPALLHATAGDSLFQRQLKTTKQREVRNYIRPTVYLNTFTAGDREIKGPQTVLNNRLGKYSFIQSNLGFYTPLYTKTKFSGKDSIDVNTFHLLMTVNMLGDQPRFSGLDKQHKLYKVGLGVRAIYGFGSQFILFADLSPYAIGDKYDKQQTQRLRLASTIVFNFMYSPKLSFRVGATRTFLWGNRNYLPMFGFRVGRLDGKCYFSFQFPRHISVNFQPGPKFSWSIYTRAYGGLYNISNGDSLYNGLDSVIQFGQRGLANGVRFDFRPHPSFAFFVSSGLAVQNHIWFYSYSYNVQNGERPFAHFYDGKPEPTLFLHFGITVRFGQAKKSQGNYLMYDIFDLNNTMDPGDNNDGPGNSDIRNGTGKKEMQKVQYQDVSDLIQEADLY